MRRDDEIDNLTPANTWQAVHNNKITNINVAAKEYKRGYGSFFDH